MTNLKFLKPESLTWNQVWERLRTKFGDIECKCEQTGEVWQYMGSVVRGTLIEHQFRHRSYKGKREYWSTYTDHTDDYQ